MGRCSAPLRRLLPTYKADHHAYETISNSEPEEARLPLLLRPSSVLFCRIVLRDVRSAKSCVTRVAVCVSRN